MTRKLFLFKSSCVQSIDSKSNNGIVVEHVHRAAVYHVELKAARRGRDSCESRAGEHHVLRQSEADVD